MRSLTYEIVIEATKKQVWETMLDDEQYSQWAKAFSPASQFVGTWEQNTEMQFFDPDLGGTLALLTEVTPYDRLVAEHTAMLTKELVRQTSGAEAEKWIGSQEIYNLSETNGSTTLVVEMITHEDFADMFDSCWPDALQNLKRLVESK